MTENNTKLKIMPIGGLHEIGKNMTLFEYGEDILIVDCGMSFPDSEMLGIDVVIPDFSYLEENSEKVKGLIITHAHEDHIGGVPYLLQKLNVPIYTSRLTLAFIKNKLSEFKIEADLHEISAGQSFRIGCFKIETIHMTHSVADSLGFAIDTPCGKIVFTGDFKVDYTPVDGERIDLARLAQLGSDGVMLLMADSTNAVRKGFTPSEREVGISLGNIFRNTKSRIIIATFSSNVHRVQKIIDLASETGRKVAVSGRSMENMVSIAKELGYLNVPAGTIIDLKQIKNYLDDQLVVITTGSQGEPMSALARMANNEHKDVHIRENDVVILSSSPVPGNEKTVSTVLNLLMERGATVLYNDIADTHVSGHACEEELKLIQSLIRPKYFMPIHGEFRHLKRHAEIAEDLGLPEENIILAENGCVVEMSRTKVELSNERVPAEAIMVDGLGVGDVGSAVINERRKLSESGVVVISACYDEVSGHIIDGPYIHTRGLVYVKEYGQILEEARHVLEDALDEAYDRDMSLSEVKDLLRITLKRFIYRKTNRDPVIIPVFTSVD